MKKMKNAPTITLCIMLSISALNAEESQPWWKTSKSKSSKEKAPKIVKKAQPKPPLVSKEQKTPWWKQTQKQEKQFEVAKSITPKTEKIDPKKANSEIASSSKGITKKKESGFWSKLFSSRKTTDKEQTQQQIKISEESAPEPEVVVKEKEIKKAPSFSFLKNIFKRPVKKDESNDIVKTEIKAQKTEVDKAKETKATPAPQPKKQVVEKQPTKTQKSEPKEIKTTVTVVPQAPAETSAEHSKQTSAASNFFKNLFKKADSATKLSSKRRIKRLGNEDEGYYVPSVSQKLRRKGRTFHQFNT
jgi:hypothetical protein